MIQEVQPEGGLRDSHGSCKGRNGVEGGPGRKREGRGRERKYQWREKCGFKERVALDGVGYGREGRGK